MIRILTYIYVISLFEQCTIYNLLAWIKLYIGIIMYILCIYIAMYFISIYHKCSRRKCMYLSTYILYVHIYCITLLILLSIKYSIYYTYIIYIRLNPHRIYVNSYQYYTLFMHKYITIYSIHNNAQYNDILLKFFNNECKFGIIWL